MSHEIPKRTSDVVSRRPQLVWHIGTCAQISWHVPMAGRSPQTSATEGSMPHQKRKRISATASRIALERKRRGFTQLQLATAIGLGRTTIKAYETGAFQA